MRASLSGGAAPPTELELKLETHRPLPAQAERLSLTFPRPLADIVAPATIVIAAADNVELTPQVAELVGLSPDSTAIRLPGRQRPPLVYRDLGGGEPALFAAEMRTLTRDHHVLPRDRSPRSATGPDRPAAELSHRPRTAAVVFPRCSAGTRDCRQSANLAERRAAEHQRDSGTRGTGSVPRETGIHDARG